MEGRKFYKLTIILINQEKRSSAYVCSGRFYVELNLLSSMFIRHYVDGCSARAEKIYQSAGHSEASYVLPGSCIFLWITFFFLVIKSLY